jgi:hypothetical protein
MAAKESSTMQDTARRRLMQGTVAALMLGPIGLPKRAVRQRRRAGGRRSAAGLGRDGGYREQVAGAGSAHGDGLVLGVELQP